MREDEKSWLQQAGTWRFGVNFDSTGVDFPFRWAIGRPEDLEKRIIDGQEQYYLMPGKRGQVARLHRDGCGARGGHAVLVGRADPRAGRGGERRTWTGSVSTSACRERARQSTTLAIIVVSYKVRDLLRACLTATYASLAASPELDATVWVVDNASGDGSAEMVAAEFPQAKLIAHGRQPGFRRRQQPGADSTRIQAIPLDDLRSLGISGDWAPERPRTWSCCSIRTPNRLATPSGKWRASSSPIPPRAAWALSSSTPTAAFSTARFAFPGLLQLWFDLFPPRPARLLDSRLNGRYPRSHTRPARRSRSTSRSARR